MHRKGGTEPGRAPCRSVFSAHGQVHEGEHIELRHDGEAQEHAVQEKAPAPELLVQLPLVQMNTKHLQHTEGSEGSREGPWAGHGFSLGPQSPSHVANVRTPKSRRGGVRTCCLWENHRKSHKDRRGKHCHSSPHSSPGFRPCSPVLAPPVLTLPLWPKQTLLPEDTIPQVVAASLHVPVPGGQEVVPFASHCHVYTLFLLSSRKLWARTLKSPDCHTLPS